MKKNPEPKKLGRREMEMGNGNPEKKETEEREKSPSLRGVLGSDFGGEIVRVVPGLCRCGAKCCKIFCVFRTGNVLACSIGRIQLQGSVLLLLVFFLFLVKDYSGF